MKINFDNSYIPSDNSDFSDFSIKKTHSSDTSSTTFFDLVKHISDFSKKVSSSSHGTKILNSHLSKENIKNRIAHKNSVTVAEFMRKAVQKAEEANESSDTFHTFNQTSHINQNKSLDQLNREWKKL